MSIWKFIDRHTDRQADRETKLSLSGNPSSKWKMGILLQRLPEGELHETKQKSHWSLRWQIEMLNNCITAIIFGNGRKLISWRYNVSASYSFAASHRYAFWLTSFTISIGNPLFAFAAFFICVIWLSFGAEIKLKVETIWADWTKRPKSSPRLCSMTCTNINNLCCSFLTNKLD